tara:strand:- start:100 stop:558 length:459 start_codon:yes stop_codon:yes gene_type:complete
MLNFIDKHIETKVGEIKHINGQILGSHNGIQHYTVGQRKGLGIAWSEPLYVKRLDHVKNIVYVASVSDLLEREALVKELNWVSIEEPHLPVRVEAQIRYRSKPIKAKLIPQSKDNFNKRLKLVLDEPQSSITPGQAAVFYKEDILLGGGLIC